MARELVKRSIWGIFFGAFATIVIMGLIIHLGDMESINGPLFIKNSIAAMIFGGVVSVAPLLFQIRKLNLLYQTLLHFVFIMFFYFSVALSVGWLPFTLTAILDSVLVFIVLYVLSWIGFYLYFRYVAKQMTKNLQNCE